MRLVQTSGAAPEQYDVYCGDTQVGYLRLRWGHFSAHLHGSGGPIVYEAYTIGDGIFDFNERDEHLRNAVAEIAKRIYTIEWE